MLHSEVLIKYTYVYIYIYIYIYVTQHSKIRNKSGLPKLANQLQSARMGIFGWKGRFSDIGEFS